MVTREKKYYNIIHIEIRMIGKMKMVFDEVKLYGTSFKVETSEKRNEVIAHFENLLQSRMIIMEDPNKLKQKGTFYHQIRSLVTTPRFYHQVILVICVILSSFLYGLHHSS